MSETRQPIPRIHPPTDRYMTGLVLEIDIPDGPEIAVRDGDGWRWIPAGNAS